MLQRKKSASESTPVKKGIVTAPVMRMYRKSQSESTPVKKGIVTHSRALNPLWSEASESTPVKKGIVTIEF